MATVFLALLYPLSALTPDPETKTADFFEVLPVTPSRKIDHEVNLKGPFDSDVTETFLSGPRLFSQAIGHGDKSHGRPRAYLNWYRIERPTDEPARVLSVEDELQGGSTYSITLGSAAMLLSPAQRLKTGPASAIPERLNHFKAYKIVKGGPNGRDVELTGTLGPSRPKVLKPAYFCVPVEHWHHDEHSPVKSINDCLVVYELESRDVKNSVTTLDQFGINTLKTTSSKWLCVPARLVRDAADTKK